MTEPWTLAIALVAAYLAGSFPTATLVARSQGVDIYSVGSGNPGASNVSRALGRGWAVLVFVVDAAKGAVPVATGLWLMGLSSAWSVGLGAAAVLGHVWPITMRFKGGRGVATAAGAVAVVAPPAVLIAGAVWLLLACTTNKASVASLAALPVGSVVAFLVVDDSVTAGVLGATAALVVFRHLPNIKRLLRGEEHDLGSAPESEIGGSRG